MRSLVPTHLVRSIPNSLRRGGLLRHSLLGVTFAGLGIFAAHAAGKVDHPPEAVGRSSFDNDKPRVEVQLLTDVVRVAPGEAFRVGVLLTADPGWHIYDADPGEAALPTTVRWNAPGVELDPLIWPKSETFGGTNGAPETHGYSGSVLLASTATVHGTKGPASLSVGTTVSFLACKHKCIPGQVTLRRNLPLGAATEVATPEVVALFDGKINETNAALSPHAVPSDTQGAAQVSPTPKATQESPTPSGPVAPQILGASPTPPESGLSLAYVLLLAFLGGLVLNLMPCVLPVLALKVFALSRLAHESKRAIVSHAAAYTVGVVGSLVALSSVVIALRAAGHRVGWGFQFQHPLYVAVVAALLVVLALNLWGVFEIQFGAQRLVSASDNLHGLARSAFEGALAVVLATPCSAPFLATAAGFALASSAPVILSVFTVLGLGLAAPLVALSLIPGLSRFMPKPGAWMMHVKQALGFVLTLTTIWLVWVYGRSTNIDAMAGLLVWLTVIAAAVRLQTYSSAWSRPRRLVTLALTLLVVGVTTNRTIIDVGGGEHEEPAALAWSQYSETALNDALKQGRTTFVDFTADWCLTCKANERLVLNDPRVIASVKARDVVMLRADWTRQDEVIRQTLARFGKAGVPMYLVYAPKQGAAPEVLPENLTVEHVLSALEAAAL